jgi:hypothetical protein
MQREFASGKVISGELSVNGELTNTLLPQDLAPFCELHILDIRLLIGHLILPEEFCDLSLCSSYAVTNYRFENLTEVLGGSVNLRSGMGEVLTLYKKLLENESPVPFIETSTLNLALLESAG